MQDKILNLTKEKEEINNSNIKLISENENFKSNEKDLRSINENLITNFKDQISNLEEENIKLSKN